MFAVVVTSVSVATSKAIDSMSLFTNISQDSLNGEKVKLFAVLVN